MISQQNVRPRAPHKAAKPRAHSHGTSAAPAFTCSRCGHKGVRHSGAQDILAPVAREVGFRIYRCRACHASYFEEV